MDVTLGIGTLVLLGALATGTRKHVVAAAVLIARFRG